MITEFRVLASQPISRFDYHAMARQFRHEGFGNCKIKLKREADELVFYASKGIHSFKFDCLNNYNFTYHVLSRRLMGDGESVVPATLTANQFTHYLDVSRLTNVPFWLTS